MLKELAPGVHVWQSKDTRRFQAFAIAGDGEVVLIDPVELDKEEEQQVRALGTVKAILITCPWHERVAAAAAKAFGAPIYGDPAGLAEFENKDAKPFPAELPLGLEVLQGTGSCAGQVVLYLPRDGGALISGDFWHNIPMKEVPWFIRPILLYIVKLRDGLHLFPPTKATNPAQMVDSGKKMLADRPVDKLFVSHGHSLLSGAGKQLAERLTKGP